MMDLSRPNSSSRPGPPLHHLQWIAITHVPNQQKIGSLRAKSALAIGFTAGAKGLASLGPLATRRPGSPGQYRGAIG